MSYDNKDLDRTLNGDDRCECDECIEMDKFAEFFNSTQQKQIDTVKQLRRRLARSLWFARKVSRYPVAESPDSDYLIYQSKIALKQDRRERENAV